MSFSLITGTSLLMLAIHGTTLATTIEPSPLYPDANEKGWELPFWPFFRFGFFGEPDIALDGSNSSTNAVSTPVDQVANNGLSSLLSIKDDVIRGVVEKSSPFKIEAVVAKMNATKTPDIVLDVSPTSTKAVVSTPVVEDKTVDGKDILCVLFVYTLLLLYTLGITLLFFFILYRIMRYRIITRDRNEATKKRSLAEVFTSNVKIIENEKIKECV